MLRSCILLKSTRAFFIVDQTLRFRPWLAGMHRNFKSASSGWRRRVVRWYQKKIHTYVFKRGAKPRRPSREGYTEDIQNDSIRSNWIKN